MGGTEAVDCGTGGTEAAGAGIGVVGIGTAGSACVGAVCAAGDVAGADGLAYCALYRAVCVVYAEAAVLAAFGWPKCGSQALT